MPRGSPKLRSVTLALTALLLVASSACKKDDPATTPVENVDDPGGIAEDGADSATAETDSALVTSSLVSATASSGSLTLASEGDLSGDELAAAGLGDGAKLLYIPAHCLTVTSDAAARTVTYVFDKCAGPNGIYRITGTVKATYATAPGLLTLDIVGSNMVVNRASVDWSSHAEIATAGAARSMTWKAQLSGTTARGREFSRTDQKTVTWRFGEKCFGVSGLSEGNVRGRYLKTEITAFNRCQGQCPEAGGSISISNAAKTKVELTFDGTSEATYSTPKGTIKFDLGCGA